MAKDKKSNIVRLAVSNKAATLEEIGEIDFEAVPEFINFQNDFKLCEKHEERLRSLAIASRWAITILGKTKAEVIEVVKACDDSSGSNAIEEVHKSLESAHGLADSIKGMIDAASHRLGVAMVAALPKGADHASAEPIAPSAIEVTDGDTIRVAGKPVRLIGFDAPEYDTHARCDRELEIADRATLRLRDLVNGGDLDLTFVRCSCPSGTEGTKLCNYGRACGVLTAKGKDVGATLISEGLARPYLCGHDRCPKRQPWC